MLDITLWPLVDEFRKRHTHGLGDAAQKYDRTIALADFKFSEIALRNLRMLRERLPRHTAAAAHGAYAFAEQAEIVLGCEIAARAAGFLCWFGPSFHGCRFVQYNA